MNALDILRRVTKPKTDAQAVEAVVKRYGATVRENVSNDDPATERRAAFLAARYPAMSSDRNGSSSSPLVA